MRLFFDKIDHMTNHPTSGLFLGLSTMGVSLVSAIELGTTILGFVGALCGAILGLRSVYILIRDRSKNK